MDHSDADLDRRIGAADTVRSAFENLGLLAASYAGPELRAVAANAGLRALTGRADVIGRPYAELFPEMESQQILEMLQRVHRTRREQVGREWRFQIGSTADGPVPDVFLDFVVMPHPEDDDAVICYAIDVTERVRQREKATDAQHRYEASRDVVDELQRALLPTELPVVPHLDIAARYLIASHDQAAGGDWFDPIVLDDDRVALVVGDVVGHGVAASAAMGQLRAVVEQTLITGTDLASAITQIDAFAARKPALRATTLAVVEVTPATGAVRYCLCGHPPPLVIGTGRTTRYLPVPVEGSQPLGLGHRHVLAETRLAAGDVVLLYTDGLIERPGHTLDEGYHRIARIGADAAANQVLPTGAAATPAARVCQLTVELMTRGGHDDDVTTLAAQLLAAPPPELAVSVVTDETGLNTAMAATRAWLDGLAADMQTTLTLELAINEAIANVAEHAYPAGGPLRLTGRLGADGCAQVTIADDGAWRPPEAGRESRGLSMIDRLIDHVAIRHEPATTVVLRHRISRAALVASTAAPAAPDSPAARIYASEVHRPAEVLTLRVMGAIDCTNAQRFAADLSDAAQGGTVALTVDLNAVTMLSSMAVRALFHTRDQLDGQRNALTLAAAPGSPAASVLDLVGLARE
ncbi:SpoIIE family protein phosphatase [Mycolicibacterium bacteremicum]|uniref:SpoIIE family protein phosphatase n=1 Tax=Mycolicibacterium bacteremicum TaxID=564198 RepID=UPI0026EC2331|nr:SpoIIE family protein phosphatase [Mycolicibacterium bacteremicum]